MFSKIMVPVDLAHTDRLAKAIDTACALASLWGAELVFVGVAAAVPGSIAHNPQEFGDKLTAFADSQAAAHGITATAHAAISHDPATDLDPTLLKAVDEIGADLVVMASHIPNLTDYVWPSNGGTVATRASASVFVVRG
ncbi:universal stress protein [Vannielia litorea]|uniref:universal stress protein n=1 Tax=Vannielia litorea TaxID=1217970 RepID=UPI001BCF3317|nr:universal stress protein [Vannielia litorea]MBS8225978.1 universal stress protein [Vannielia litorea]